MKRGGWNFRRKERGKEGNECRVTRPEQKLDSMASASRLPVAGRPLQGPSKGVSATVKVWSNTVRIPQLKLSEKSCPIVTDLDDGADLVRNFLLDGQGKTLVITGAGIFGSSSYLEEESKFVINGVF